MTHRQWDIKKKIELVDKLSRLSLIIGVSGVIMAVIIRN